MLTGCRSGLLWLVLCLLLQEATSAPAAAVSTADEAVTIEQECKNNSVFSAYHDCACVASRLATYRKKYGPAKPLEPGQLVAGDECTASRQSIYKYHFEEDKKHKPPVGESGCVSRDCAAKRKQAEAVIEFV